MKIQFVPSALLTALVVLFVNGIPDATSGATLYQDNFDNVAVGLGFNPPSPQVGTYVSGNARVRTGAAVPPSVPNYLENNRNNDQQPIISGLRGDLDGSPVGPGTTMHAEAMMYAFDGYPVFGINKDATNPFPWDNATGDGVVLVNGSPDGSIVYAVGPTGGLVATGLSHQKNVWEKWQIDYVVGASSYQLTVGANSVTLGASYMKNSAATEVGGVMLDSFSGSTRNLVDDMLVTAIPEPASLSLLVLSGMALLGRGRRFKS